jgi:ketosteroid isomerase-like protein
MSQQNVEIVKRIFARWERGDFSSVDWADPEIEYVVPGPDPQVHRGIEAMNRSWGEWLEVFEDMTVHLKEIREAGDRVVIDQDFRGRGRGSGIPVDLPGAAVFTFRDGKVIRFAGHTNLESALKEAGIDEV